MASRDRRIDDYIAKSAGFARPILSYLRDVVHEACPGVEETIRWGMPHFLHHGILCRIAAFKQHCAFGFWRRAQLVGDDARAGEALGQFGRITRTGDLPPRRTLLALVRRAARLNEAVVRPAARPKRRPRPAPRVPSDLRAALAANARARRTFAALPPSGRREYVEWLLEAKRAETRARRLAQALAWLAAGKARNWQYAR
jgi:hypothetical protein